ncbi:MAG: 2-amino-4-hydroxy-6-hydroxymethyldihydropteridine diphosphokinase [Anaerolineae bacterium]|nr:2-amino-4-hydroxy-6-hydroxymethyldihydropteridine diphosphokinase [Anaerolineae bacterium]
MTSNTVFISLGSNTQPEYNLREAVRLLREYVTVITVSPVYETAPVSGEGRSYLNAAAQLETDLNPVDLKANVLRIIENRLGRMRDSSGDVTIDLDILLFNDEQHDLGKRQIPDPGILQYAHVAIPLADVAPDIPHPVTGERLETIAAQFRDVKGIRLCAEINL